MRRSHRDTHSKEGREEDIVIMTVVDADLLFSMHVTLKANGKAWGRMKSSVVWLKVFWTLLISDEAALEIAVASERVTSGKLIKGFPQARGVTSPPSRGETKH